MDGLPCLVICHSVLPTVLAKPNAFIDVLGYFARACPVISQPAGLQADSVSVLSPLIYANLREWFAKLAHAAVLGGDYRVKPAPGTAQGALLHHDLLEHDL